MKLSDSNGNVLLQIKDDRVLVGRNRLMRKDVKEFVIDVYEAITLDKNHNLQDFLDYKEENPQFCTWKETNLD